MKMEKLLLTLKRTVLLIVIALGVFGCANRAQKEIDLSGTWKFKMDSLDIGVSEKWYSQDFSEIVQLPGSMVENGKGLDISLETKWTGQNKDPKWFKDPNYSPYHHPDNFRFPFWLQPLKKYTGVAWYQKMVIIPKAWEEKNIWLNLERPHWQSTIWINGKNAGIQNSLAVPHKFNITPFVKTGENTISICIDNRSNVIDVGKNSHSISDHTQSNWNGIVGDISLQSADRIYLKTIQVFPNTESNSIEIVAILINNASQETAVNIEVITQLKGSKKETPKKHFEFNLPVGESIVKMDYPIQKNVLTWDEFSPNVYELSFEMDYRGGKDSKTMDFGFRDLKADSNGITINGRPVFFRGTLECAIFPKTGYPPTSSGEWEKIYNAARSHGRNHIRFHSWCPPEAAFTAADASAPPKATALTKVPDGT